MNYALGCAFNLDELFMNLNKDRLKLTSDLCEKINNDRHKSLLIKQIFRESMKIIFNDIIDNNVTFELPTGARKSDIHLKKYSKDYIAKGRRNGKWLDVDFLKSMFTGYQLVLNMYNKDGGVTRTKPIYLNKEYKKKITDNTNAGKQYC